MRKTVTLLIGAASVAALLAITACKQFSADIEEDFSYWAAEPVITGFKIDPSVKTQQNNNRVLCVPSAGPVTVTMEVHNPKNFSFIMPNSPGAPTDIVSFGDDKVKGSGGAKPVYGADYTLVPTSDGKALELTYTSAFLKANEWSDANIGASIKLYSTDGRKFNQTYKFDLEANTPPPDPAPVEAAAGKIALFKTYTADSQGKHYYVLCFKADDLPGENMPAGVPLHSDLSHVYVSKNGGTETAYPVTLTTGHTDFDISDTSNTAFIAYSDVDSLDPAEAAVFSGSPQPGIVPSGPWVLYLKTNVPVGEAAAKYGIRLFDGKLYSARAEQSIGKRELPAPKVFAHADMDTTAVSGVYTEKGATNASGNEDLNATNSAAHSGSVTDPIPVYSAYGNAVKLLVKKDDGNPYPAGVILRQGVQLVSGSGLNGSIDVKSDFIKLPSPKDGGGEAVYKVTVKATGEGFDDSIERTLYYKVRREVKAVSSTLPMWHILKKAIDETSAGGTVVVNGEIKATDAGGNNGEITIGKSLTIEKADGATSAVINANKNNLSNGNKDRIFKVESGKTLTLKNLTLKGGMRPTGGGAAGIFVDSGAAASLTDCRIIDCVNKSGEGGAVYTKGTLSLTRGSISGTGSWEGNQAKDGGGIYVKEGSCTLTETKILNNYADGGIGTGEGKGGGIYIEKGTCELDGVTLQSNTVKNGSPNKGKGSAVYLAKTASDTPTLTLKDNVQIGTSDPNSNTVCLGYVEIGSTIHTAFVSATSADLSDSSHINIEPEDYIKQSNQWLIRGKGIKQKKDKFHLTNMPTGETWELSETVGGITHNNELQLQRKSTVLTAPTAGSWKALREIVQSLSDNGTLILNGTFTATSGDDSGEIVIDKNLTIKKEESASSAVLNADTKCRIFKVQNGKMLTLENLTLKNGMATGTDEEGYGGAVYTKGGTVNMTTCTLTGNTAAGGTNGYGGAIFASGATVDMTNCTFTSNTAAGTTGAGGAIFAQKNGTVASSVTISGGTIGGTGADANKVTDMWGFGGGIYVNDGCILTLNEYTDDGGVKHGVRIIGNEAGRAGGVRANNSTVTMENCTISGNKATDNSNLGGGGGVYTHGGTLTMTRCTLTGNTAVNNGGGLNIEKGIAVITNCTLTGNTAKENGGGVYVDGTMTMSGSATVTPSVGSDIDKPGKNDVYLKSGKTITVNGKLNPTGGTAARITPETYSETPQVQVLTGAMKDYNNYTKFTVTRASGRNWSVNDKGCLKKQ
ncbi:hypothetical protein HRI97_01900 [Treponema socranskii subsp. buccale]|uniref:hypothetical protein n=1 Tax=Treponema socranskii TaxID=53419 RepID=UPI0020A59FE3|nr:hypothetical protein [Treponema socranskii]UTD01898.1 hypothetical protein HRI97_01900 [Treponema socranskii subsp. buccale]